MDKAKAIEIKDRKRKDVKSSARKENFWQKFPEVVRTDCKCLKEWQKKRKQRIPIILFLHF
jgi:hypothetical protein